MLGGVFGLISIQLDQLDPQARILGFEPLGQVQTDVATAHYHHAAAFLLFVTEQREHALDLVRLRYVRQGRIRAVHSVGEGFGEIFDIEAAEGAEITGKTVQKIEKAGMLLVGGIVRDDAFIPAKPEEIIRQGDRVVLLSHSDYVKKAEKLFSVGVGVF